MSADMSARWAGVRRVEVDDRPVCRDEVDRVPRVVLRDDPVARVPVLRVPLEPDFVVPAVARDGVFFTPVFRAPVVAFEAMRTD